MKVKEESEKTGLKFNIQKTTDAELLSYEVSKADKWAEGIAKQAECKRSIKKTGLAQGQWPGGKARGIIRAMGSFRTLSKVLSSMPLCQETCRPCPRTQCTL